MAEIKSTIDLVMQKTEHMVMSKEEKEQQEAQQRKARAKGLVLALAERRTRPDKLLQVIEQTDPNDPSAYHRAVQEAIVEGLTLSDETEALLDGLKVLSSDRLYGLIDEVDRLIKEFNLQKEEMSTRGLEQVLDDLASRGITGSALQPRPGGQRDFVVQLEQLENDYQTRLERLRSRMLNQL